MTQLAVLISGAGIAGPTLAWWLSRRGFRATVVERAAAIRSSGSPVDVRGPAVEVVRQMGLLPRMRAAATSVKELLAVNGAGRQVGRIDSGALERASGSGELEIPRGDLASILHEASRDDAEFIFNDAIASVEQDAAGVSVTFERGAPRRFDLVIGADGLHSGVRRLVFGPEAGFVRHLGIYVATLPITGMDAPAHQVVLFNTPGKLVTIHPSRDRALAALMFRSPAIAGFDPRDTAQHRRLLGDAFAQEGWCVPEVLRQVETTPDLYCDGVSQVVMPCWSNGRVALLGDAASCVSLFGDGSTLAIAGAAVLADALAASPSDPSAAFVRYEQRHRVLVDPKIERMATTSHLLIPETRAGIALRNLATRLWPLAAGAMWLRRQAAETRAA